LTLNCVSLSGAADDAMRRLKCAAATQYLSHARSLKDRWLHQHHYSFIQEYSQ